MKKFVRGFVFDDSADNVLLVQNEFSFHPIGGEMAEGELPVEAMARWFEKYGLRITDWTNYLLLWNEEHTECTYYFVLFDSFVYWHARLIDDVVRVPLEKIGRKGSMNLELWIHHAIVSRDNVRLVVSETHQVDSSGVIAG